MKCYAYAFTSWDYNFFTTFSYQLRISETPTKNFRLFERPQKIIRLQYILLGIFFETPYNYVPSILFIHHPALGIIEYIVLIAYMYLVEITNYYTFELS
jgi:hypothetical protein